MMATARPYSLASRLRFLLWAMLLLPVCAGAAFFLLHSSQVLHETAQRDLGVSLSLERQFIEMWLSERLDDMERLAADPRVRTLRGGELRAMLEAQLKAAPEFSDFILVDAAGRIRIELAAHAEFAVADRPYFHAAMRGEGSVSDILASRATGEPVIVVTAPVLDGRGKPEGAILGVLGLDVLDGLMRTVQAGSPSRTRLLQADGAVIAPRGGRRNLPPAGDELVRSARLQQPPPWIFHDPDGTRYVGTYKWIRGGIWLLTAERPESEILAAHAWLLGVPLAGAGLVLLLVGPALLRLARAVERPLAQLEAHARQIEAGNYDVGCAFLPQGQAPEEVRRLNQAYCLMVERVRSALEELRAASLTDPLTGVANRKYLFGEGPRLLDAAARGGRPVSVLMLDLDHFKDVNDTYGHAAGDAVLAGFAERVRGLLRKSDLFARFGGEEFVVLAPNAGAAEARELAERIRSAVALLRVAFEGTAVSFTVSIGVATLLADGGIPSGGGDPLEELLMRADAALYAAKTAGRNRVEAVAPVLLPAGNFGAGPSS